MLNLLASAAIGIGGSLLSGNAQKKALNKQLEAQKYATDQSIAFQRDALFQQQQNLAPYLQSGYAALQQLQSQFGLGAPSGGSSKSPGGFAGTSPAEGAASGGGQADWGDYLNRYTDVAAEYQRLNSTQEGRAALANIGAPTPEAFAQWHATVQAPSLGENRVVNNVQAAPGGAGTGANYGPQVDPRPTYARPDQPVAPAMPDLSAAAYQKSPGFEAGLLSGQRNLNANFAARGLLGSGAGAEAAIKFGTDYQNQDYANWRNNELAKWQMQLAQFNQDRANTNTNFNQDRAFGTGAFESDRGYDTSRFDTNIGNLFQLAGMGNPSQLNGAIQQNANNMGGLLQTGANNLSSIYGQQAANTGGLIGNLTGIGQGLLQNGGFNFGGLFGGGGSGMTNWSQGWGGGS